MKVLSIYYFVRLSITKCLYKKYFNSGIFFNIILDVYKWSEFTISVGRLFSLILFLTPV